MKTLICQLLINIPNLDLAVANSEPSLGGPRPALFRAMTLNSYCAPSFKSLTVNSGFRMDCDVQGNHRTE